MASFKSLFIAVMALINVAICSTAFSSEMQRAVTSIQYLTSFTTVSALASTSSNKACDIATVTESMATPNSTATVPGHYGESNAMSTSAMNITKTITTSSTRTVTRTSFRLMNHTISTLTDANATSMMPISSLTPSPSHHVNASSTSRTKIIITRTSSSATISPTYAAPNNSLPLFTAAADATNVGAAILAGGFLMALGF